MRFKEDPNGEWYRISDPSREYECTIQRPRPTPMPQILPGDLIYTTFERKYCVAAVYNGYVQIWNAEFSLGCVSNHSVTWINRAGEKIWER